jgi:hypothetical protein
LALYQVKKNTIHRFNRSTLIKTDPFCAVRRCGDDCLVVRGTVRQGVMSSKFYTLPLNASGVPVDVEATLTPLRAADNTSSTPEAPYVDVRLRGPTGGAWMEHFEDGTRAQKPAANADVLEANVMRYGSERDFGYTMKVCGAVGEFNLMVT